MQIEEVNVVADKENRDRQTERHREKRHGNMTAGTSRELRGKRKGRKRGNK